MVGLGGEFAFFLKYSLTVCRVAGHFDGHIIFPVKFQSNIYQATYRGVFIGGVFEENHRGDRCFGSQLAGVSSSLPSAGLRWALSGL